MKSSTQVILPFLVLAGMLKDAQSCGGLSRQACNDALFCMWDRFNGSGCVPTFWLAHATQFNIIPSGSDAPDDYELLHKGRPNQVGYVVDVDKNIDSIRHSDSGDDVSDYGYDYDYGGNDPEYDLYPYDEDMDEDYEDINSDEYNPYGEDMDEDEDSNSSSLDLDGETNANGDASIIKKYLRSN